MSEHIQPISSPRNALGDISMLYVSVLLRAAAEEGASVTRLIADFGLNQEALATPEARISIPRFMRLGHGAIIQTKNPALGLRMGALTRPIDAGISGLAGQSAATIEDALTTLIRYSLLTSRNSRGTPTISSVNREVRFYSIRPYNGFNFFVIDSVLAGWTQFVRSISGQYAVLERVSIEYAPIGLDDQFERWFGCPVQFNADKNSITFKTEIWAQPSLQTQPAMYEKLSALCEQELQQIRRGWTTSDRVKNLLTPLFKGESPALETIARKLGTAPRTLQRELASENTGFRELVDETRRQLAHDYIRETDVSLAEIAWLSGFANPTALHKAYQRWFNISPGEHRKSIRGNTGPVTQLKEIH